MKHLHSVLRTLDTLEVSQTPFGPANFLDMVLTQIIKAAVADGLDRKVAMRLLVDHAYGVLVQHPRDQPAAVKAVLDEVLKLHTILDDPRQPDA